MEKSRSIFEVIVTDKEKKTKKPRKKEKLDPLVESEVFEEVEFTDPKTGKRVKQKVKIVRYKTIPYKAIRSVLEEDDEALFKTIESLKNKEQGDEL